MVEPTARQATLFVRETLPDPACHRREQIETRLQTLLDSGVLSSVSVQTWAKRRPVDDDDHYEQFAAWAERTGVSLSPSFNTRTCYVQGTTERREYRARPALCLVLYDDSGTITAVYPHNDGGPKSVLDGLSEIGQGSDRSPAASDPGIAD